MLMTETNNLLRSNLISCKDLMSCIFILNITLPNSLYLGKMRVVGMFQIQVKFPMGNAIIGNTVFHLGNVFDDIVRMVSI